MTTKTWTSFDSLQPTPFHGAWFQPAGWINGKWNIAGTLYDSTPAGVKLAKSRGYTHYIINETPTEVPGHGPFEEYFAQWKAGKIVSAGDVRIPITSRAPAWLPEGKCRELLRQGWNWHEESTGKSLITVAEDMFTKQ